MHGLAQTYNNLGLVYHDKGEWDRAIEFYQKSLEGKEKVGDVHGLAKTYGNLGLLYFQQQNYSEAVRLHVEIMLLFKKLGAAPLVQQAGGILAGFRQQLDEAAFDQYFKESLSRILAEGITWGRHQVVKAEEVQSLLASLNLQ